MEPRHFKRNAVPNVGGKPRVFVLSSDGTAAELRQPPEAAEERIRQLETQLDAERERIRQLEKAAVVLITERNAVLSSTSWWITAPLRWMVDRVR